ncbi:3-oxoacyl-[acyl-carrier-protein] reductase FabG [bacterium BMS3Abin03]|nr:3-oxoacyl-[acyl-carrier-protein] reductase FabG [bacterium BMS3Abin03]
MNILITGSRKGIGRKIAEYYLEKNHRVFGCSRNESDLTHQNYTHFTLNVTDEKAVLNLFKEIRKNEEKLDVLINNAGIASMNHSFLMPVETARNILDTNVIGTFLFSREAAKLMKKNKWGRIINFVTFAIPFKLEGEAIYAASKAAVATLTEILSKEYADYGITVNAVAPPAVKTDLIKGVAQEKMDILLKRQSIHRFGKPEEVCNVIDFFIKPESSMINGQIVYMGGV